MRLGVLAVTLAVSTPALADDTPDPDAIQFHGFITQGFLKSSDNNFLADSSSGSFDYFEAGLNASKPLSDNLRVGLQLFTQNLGPTGDYRMKLDWGYFDYHLHDWIGFRAGRIKLPFGLYNDTSDIDAAHPSALLPQSVYPAADRNFLLAQTGFELYGYRELGRSGGGLEYRAYAGTIYVDTATTTPGSPIVLTSLTIPYIVGGRLMWETPVPGLRIGASIQQLKLETQFLDLSDGAPFTANIPATLGVASIEYAVDDALFAFEYSRWHTSIDSSNQMVVPDTSATDIRAYAMMAYRVRPWLQPSMYYSLYLPETGVTGPAAKQDDAAVTLRFDITPNWIIKLEGHSMRGTAALSTALNPGFTLDTLADHWVLFVGKTTVYF